MRWICLGLLLLHTQLHAEDLHQPRTWTGINGKSFQGSCLKLSEDGKTAEIEGAQKKIYRIALDHLSEADRRWIEFAAGIGTPTSAFRTLPDLDRTKLPVINQSKYGQKASDCVPSSFCNFLIWWDQEKMLEIPKRGDFDAKLEWVHSRMARLCETRNTAGTNLSNAKEGFGEYFQKELPEVATFRFHADYDFRPENLARYTVGANATMLGMTTVQSNGKKSGHWVALVSAEPSGRIVFHTWGTRFEGMMKPLEVDQGTISLNGQKVPRTTYEIHLSNKDELPEWVKTQEIRFVLDPIQWDGIFVVRPYIFAEKGKALPAPADELFDSKPNAPAQL